VFDSKHDHSGTLVDTLVVVADDELLSASVQDERQFIGKPSANQSPMEEIFAR
jgi:hypothetical protein